MKNKAVIFDLYDTLIFLGQNRDPCKKLFFDLGLDHKKMQWARNIALTQDFKNLTELTKKVAPNSSINLKPYEDNLAQDLATATLFPETVSTLQILKSKGVKIGMISNASSEYMVPFFKLGLDKLVDKYVMSCQVGHKKPEAKIYEIALNMLGTKPQETIMTGDSARCDVYGPQAVGMEAMLLDRKGTSSMKLKISTLDEIILYL